MRFFLIFILIQFGTWGFGQHKYPGPVKFIEGYYKIDSIVIAGSRVGKFPFNIPSKDTLSNCEIKFKSSVGKITVSETYLVIKSKVVVHFQLNTFDKKNTTHLVELSHKILGHPIKEMTGVKSALFFWSHQTGGQEIHTVLITAKGGKKGEFISWIV